MWLARVGPASTEAWACGMGWSRPGAFSHAKRLERAGWIERYPTVRGHGSLLVATRPGVQMSGVAVTAAGRPAPTWWAHLHACGWVAAWLSARGRGMQGGREVIADPGWRGEISWRDGKGQHKSGHRPDLAVLVDGGRIAVEVELQRKSTERLRAIIALHARWRAAGNSGGLIYVCGDQPGGARVREIAAERGLSTDGGGLRVELLETIQQQTREAWAARSPRQSPSADDG